MRRALNYAFDFEEMNKQIFYGQYKRISSYFDGIDELMATGLPQGKELEILETVRAEVPPEVFTTAYTNPVGGSPEAVRDNLREALRLFKEAGYEVRDRKLIDVKTGAQFSLELLNSDPSFERITLFYKPSLERLGIAVSVRTVDPPVREQDCASGISTSSPTPGASRSRRATSSASSGSQDGRHRGFAQYYRHQESGGRQADRAGDLRQGSRRSRRGNQGAGPRAAVESLRRAAVDLYEGRAPRAGIVSAGRRNCPNTASPAFPFIWWYDADKAARIGKKS